MQRNANDIAVELRCKVSLDASQTSLLPAQCNGRHRRVLQLNAMGSCIPRLARASASCNATSRPTSQHPGRPVAPSPRRVGPLVGTHRPERPNSRPRHADMTDHPPGEPDPASHTLHPPTAHASSNRSRILIMTSASSSTYNHAQCTRTRLISSCTTSRPASVSAGRPSS